MLETMTEAEWVLWVQKHGAMLFWPVRALSELGPSTGFGVLLAGLYWCWDYQAMARVWFVNIAASWLTSVLKLCFHTPRPYWIHPEIKGLTHASGFGMPSGHCLVATAVWGELRRLAPARVAWWGFVLIVAGVGFSRFYLGVHSLAQVGVGITLGATFVYVYPLLEGRVRLVFDRLSFGPQLGALFLISLGAVGLSVGVRLLLDRWEMPAEWEALALQKRPEDGPINPRSLHSCVMMAGWLFGFLSGYWLLRRSDGMKNAAGWRDRGLRMVLGSAVLGPYAFVTRRMFRGERAEQWSFGVALTLDYAYGMTMGFLIAFGIPWLFRRFRI